jgi:hypothetical protein
MPIPKREPTVTKLVDWGICSKLAINKLILVEIKNIKIIFISNKPEGIIFFLRFELLVFLT